MHLYFVFLLLQFFLIYTLIYPFLKRKRLKVKQLLMVGGLLTVVFYTISDILLWYNDSSDNHFFEWHYGKICFAWSIFIFWGIYLGENKDRLDLLKRHTLFFFGALVTFVIYLWETNRKFIIIGDNSRQYFLLSGLPFQFLAATFLLVFLYQVDLSLTNDRWYRPLYNWLANLGKDTFGIYLSHNAILLGILSLWNCFPLPNAIGVKIPAVFAVTALTSWAFVRLIGLLNPLYVRTILLGAR
ncbi:MAG: acyltransferase family protein [Candidatus Omnitrophica bacterium]|nr:acyltransferase family protein [Candidatus Omnitrophota bacterium]